MKTELIKVSDKDYEIKLNEISKYIQNGGLVIFPTDTVYGIGANALDDDACKKIFKVKNRPQDNPLIVHLSKVKDIQKFAVDIRKEFYILAENFMPGPLSVVLKRNDLLAKTVSCGLDTVAFRIPDSKFAIDLIEKSKIPIAAPSANLSGLPSSTKPYHLLDDFCGKIKYIGVSEEKLEGIESTVIDLSTEEITILRPGTISREEIEAVLNKKIKISVNSNKHIAIKSPGQKYVHYKPKARVLVMPENQSLDEFSDKLYELGINNQNAVLREYASNEEMARDLYADFRLADFRGLEFVVVNFPKDDKLREGIINRLEKAGEFLYNNKCK